MHAWHGIEVGNRLHACHTEHRLNDLCGQRKKYDKGQLSGQQFRLSVSLSGHLARGNRVGAFDIAGGLHRYDRPMLRRGGLSEGGLIMRPLNLFMPKMPGIAGGRREPVPSVAHSYDTAMVKGADAASIADVVMNLLEPNPTTRKELLRRLRTSAMDRDVSTTENSNVCLAQLANEIHTILEIDLGVKIAVAIVPTKIGATRRVRVVHTPQGWVQGAPRGSAMYGAFDGAGVSRRPLDAVMILDTHAVAGGYAPKRCRHLPTSRSHTPSRVSTRLPQSHARG